MRYITLLSSLLLLFVAPSFAQHGGHSGGRGFSGRSNHVHRGSSGFFNSGTQKTSSRSASRVTSRSASAEPPQRVPASISGMPTSINRTAVTSSGTSTVGAGVHNSIYSSPGSYGYPEYYNFNPYVISPYYNGYYPYYYDPYMMGVGMTFMYSPHYAYPENNTPNEYESEPISDMPGYVVFQLDTLSGTVSVKNNGVSVETSDSKQKYDYDFSNRKEGLKYVTVYNTDSSQLNLVRLDSEPRKLFRVVHEGKLNIYDAPHKFIYHPEDIDYRSLIVQYGGVETVLHCRSMEEAKIRLTQFVNKAYCISLDSRSFNWKDLLIYVDKLD